MTGRTHQIRVHCQYEGHPIAWDDRYGDPRFDAYTKKTGLGHSYMRRISNLLTRIRMKQWILARQWNLCQALSGKITSEM